MKFNKIKLALVAALASAGVVSQAGAAVSSTSFFEIEDTITSYGAVMYWNADAGKVSFADDSSFWDISLSAALETVNLTFGGKTFTFNDPVFSMVGTHVAAPHPGDIVPANTFSAAVKGSASGVGVLEGVVAHPAISHTDTYTYNIFQLTSDEGFAKAGDYKMEFSAVHAVPEPETYAMLLSGLGMVGLMVRRRVK